ncbi:MAG: DUF2924 domain-containing protein [Elusimicrobiaceae bacterium]|nr:DUF2924 domain-containing protein [Elusimicrobiaceae bacterium]
MQNYTHLTARELRLKRIEIIGRPIPPIGRSLIIKYLLWYEQAKREKISPLGFFHEVAQATKGTDKHPKATLEVGSKLIRSYQGIKYEVEIVANGYLYENNLYKSLNTTF